MAIIVTIRGEEADRTVAMAMRDDPSRRTNSHTNVSAAQLSGDARHIQMLRLSGIVVADPSVQAILQT